MSTSLESRHVNFLHFTDIHQDPHYNVGSNANCKQPTGCCRFIEIEKEKPYIKAGKFGNFNCDIPPITTEIVLNKTKNFLPKPHFIIWTGDTPGHHIFTQTYRGNMDQIISVSRLIKSLFPDVQVYPAFGNHDAWPVDQFRVPEYNHFMKNVVKVWNGLWNLNSTYGFYNSTLEGNITLLMTDTTWWDRHNIFSNKSMNIGDQIGWLDTFKGRERIWLSGHIFPTASEGTEEYATFMTKWIDQNVNLSIWGHSHKDWYLLFNRSVGFISPSFTTSEHHPAVRLYYYDTESGKLVNYTQYRFNIDKDLEMEFVYTSPSDYGMKGLEFEDLYNLAMEMKNNQTSVNGMRFYSNYWTGTPPKYDPQAMKGMIDSIIEPLGI